MTPIESLCRGAVLGFAIAAPVGPIGVLCIRRTLAEGPRAGFVTGLGAAFADGLYGAVAAFGLASLTSLLIGLQPWVRAIGGLLLILLGARTFVTLPASQPAEHRGRSLASAFLGTFALTLTNPATILSFVAVFAGLGLAPQRSLVEATALAAGVTIGSAAWWLVLSGVVAKLRDRFEATWRRWINRASGVLFIGFGLAALVGAFAPHAQ